IDRAAAGLTPNPAATSGRHVSGVDVVNGRVEVVYGNSAFAALAGKKLVLTPYAKREDDGTSSVVWRCGYAGVPEAAREISSYATSTVDPRYLPSGCRPPVER